MRCSACERPASVVSLGERSTRGAPALHHRPPVGLLVVAGPDHVDHALQPEQAAGHRQRRAPLAGAGLGHQPLDPGLLVRVGLGDRAVWLVRAGRRDALVLVVDLGRGIELALEAVGPVQRRGPPQLVDLAHRLGDLDLGLGRDLLRDQRHREDRRQVVRPGRLHRPRVERRERVAGQVGDQVDPVRGDAVLGQRELRRLRSRGDPKPRLPCREPCREPIARA